MTTERWGTFSVIDHQDAARMACDVLLYDRVVFPVPRTKAQESWKKLGWDPEARIDQLGPLAIRAVWSEDHHKKAQQLLEEVTLDANGEVEAALRWEATRRILAQGAENYKKPQGVDRILVYAAFQSEDQAKIHNFSELSDRHRIELDDKTARMNGLVASRILVPNERDGEESLKRALDFSNKDDFVEARRDFFEWQQDVLLRGLSPEEATERLARAIKRYNSFVENSGRSWRVETFVTTTVVAGSLAAATAAVAPGIFAPLACFGLAGGEIVTLGGSAVGAIAQLSRQAFSQPGRPEPDNLQAAAMFHQLEADKHWLRRERAIRGA